MNRKLAIILIVGPLLVMTALAADPGQNPPLQVKPQVEKMTLPAGPTMITQARLVQMVPGIAFIELTGRNFGVEKDHRLFMDGAPVPNPPLAWADRMITFEMRELIDRAPQSHEFVIMNAAGQAASNRYRAVFLATWDLGNPGSGAQESEVTLLCWGAGIQQGGRMIHLGNTPMVILSWQLDGRGQNQIRVRVPKVAPGHYRLMINDGGDKISDPGSFRVR